MAESVSSRYHNFPRFTAHAGFRPQTFGSTSRRSLVRAQYGPLLHPMPCGDIRSHLQGIRRRVADGPSARVTRCHPLAGGKVSHPFTIGEARQWVH